MTIQVRGKCVTPTPTPTTVIGRPVLPPQQWLLPVSPKLPMLLVPTPTQIIIK